MSDGKGAIEPSIDRQAASPTDDRRVKDRAADRKSCGRPLSDSKAETNQVRFARLHASVSVAQAFCEAVRPRWHYVRRTHRGVLGHRCFSHQRTCSRSPTAVTCQGGALKTKRPCLHKMGSISMSAHGAKDWLCGQDISNLSRIMTAWKRQFGVCTRSHCREGVSCCNAAIPMALLGWLRR